MPRLALLGPTLKLGRVAAPSELCRREVNACLHKTKFQVGTRRGTRTGTGQAASPPQWLLYSCSQRIMVTSWLGESRRERTGKTRANIGGRRTREIGCDGGKGERAKLTLKLLACAPRQ